MEREEEKYYTTKDLMNMFSVSRYVIYRAIKSGELVVSGKRGTENIFSEESLNNYLTISSKK